MPKPMKVKIDSLGRPLTADTSKLPTTADNTCFALSEASLAEDWLGPEEDAAWAHLQPTES
jgi:hypothetical protein